MCGKTVAPTVMFEVETRDRREKVQQKMDAMKFCRVTWKDRVRNEEVRYRFGVGGKTSYRIYRKAYK